MKHRKTHVQRWALAGILWLGTSVLGAGTPLPLSPPLATEDCPGIATMDCTNVPELICKTACNQHQSLVIRDRCTYQQKLHMERYEKPKEAGGAMGKNLQNRDTRVKITYRKDETGEYLAEPTVIEDTDDRGVPKTKVDPKANTGLASQAFLDLIFFPLLPEKLPYYEFEKVPGKFEGEVGYRFKPRPNVKGVPLAGGIAYINGQTGAMLTLQLDAMYNLEVLEKHLKDVESINATVDYSEFSGRFRMPTLARGEGLSNVTKFKGIFKFTFEESKYTAALTLPRWAEITLKDTPTSEK
ncbi:MAG: hypothetical protein K1Y36_05230 [Blastocatellia bacterium]|nr:hypothetical protein [Blastocatellia bacterium]